MRGCKVKEIRYIVIHCSDSPNDRGDTAADVKRWHLEKGFATIGYHWVIERDGKRVTGRPETMQGAHEQTVNRCSIGICMMGRDAFTEKQWAALRMLLAELLKRYPGAKVVGHCELDKGRKCPGFDVQAWLARERSVVA